MNWLPISTAPRDGTIILLWRRGDNHVVAGGYDRNAPMPWRFLEYITWNADEDHEAGDDPFNAWLTESNGPTHWLPMPEPPTDIELEGAPV